MVSSTIPSKNNAVQDDAFHILRDCRSMYLKQLGQLLQEAARAPAEAIQSFQQTVGEYFDEMTSSSRRSGFNAADGLTASRISLVGESDLELEIRLGSFTSRLMESTGGDLWRVYLRFVTLLGRPDLSTADNPVGPKGIAIGLIDFCSHLGENHEKTMARVEHLEAYFAKHLNFLYDALNTFLDQRHIEAAQPSIITAPDSSAAHTTTANTTSAAPNPAAALQQSLSGQIGNSTTVAGHSAGVQLSQASLTLLLNRLDELEKSGKVGKAFQATFSSTETHPSLETLIPGLFESPNTDVPEPGPQALKSDQLGIPTSAPEAATIDTLGLIFEALLASTVLPDPVKVVLSGLQIPMLKAAMLDQTFFVDQKHPARQLLDKIARAALGLLPDVPSTHPLCVRIQSIASKVRSEFRNDNQVFEDRIGELDLLIKERDDAVGQIATAYVPLLHLVEKRNQANRRCRQVIEQHLAHGAPIEIAAFLRNYWLKVLIIAWMENGEQSTAWQGQIKLLDDLLWSLKPKKDIEERKQLAKLLQPLVQQLNVGMNRIGMPDDVQASFLDSCFALQTAAMRGALVPQSEASKPTANLVSEDAPAVSELSSGKLLLKIFDHVAVTPGASRLRPAPARPGSWLRLLLSGEKPLCGRLCTGAPDNNLQLICNTEWEFAVAIHPDLLENMLASGSARICSNDSVFDAAAEKVLRRTGKS